MEEILVITVKRGAAGASNLTYLPQYDRFMGMGNGKGELLEMLFTGGSFVALEARGTEAQSICQQPGLAYSSLHFDPGLHYRSTRGPA